MKSDTITTARLPELAATNWGPGVPCGGARSRRCCIRNLIFAVRPAGAHRARPLLSSVPATLRAICRNALAESRLFTRLRQTGRRKQPGWRQNRLLEAVRVSRRSLSGFLSADLPSCHYIDRREGGRGQLQLSGVGHRGQPVTGLWIRPNSPTGPQFGEFGCDYAVNSPAWHEVWRSALAGNRSLASRCHSWGRS